MGKISPRPPVQVEWFDKHRSTVCSVGTTELFKAAAEIDYVVHLRVKKSGGGGGGGTGGGTGGRGAATFTFEPKRRCGDLQELTTTDLFLFPQEYQGHEHQCAALTATVAASRVKEADAPVVLLPDPGRSDSDGSDGDASVGGGGGGGGGNVELRGQLVKSLSVQFKLAAEVKRLKATAATAATATVAAAVAAQRGDTGSTGSPRDHVCPHLPRYSDAVRTLAHFDELDGIANQPPKPLEGGKEAPRRRYEEEEVYILFSVSVTCMYTGK